MQAPKGGALPKPEITQYAQWRMGQRKIPVDAVEAVLENYHTSRPAPRREGAIPTVIYVGMYMGRNLKVYVIRDSNPPKVTTAVWEGD